MSRDLLIFRTAARLCAIAVEHVEETMRPLPCEPLPDVPTFVRGASMVRGVPIPIVDVRSLLGDPDEADPRRLIVVRTRAARRVGLLVDEVLGLRPEHSLPSRELPPLLTAATAEIVEALTRLDGQLLTILHTASLVPPAVWEQVSERPA